ncbi:MAG TPA: aminoglycoside phosphotransferase family protein [Verrucomicrobiae bacterium]|jgi:thiamine kinase-like enzyme
MSDHARKEVLPANLMEHRAARAWRQVWPEWREPTGIEILKLKTKSAVYRLHGAGPGGCAVIAKRCHAATASLERMIYEEYLPRLPLRALECYGLVEEPDGKCCWLFLEDAGGHQYSPANQADRVLAGRWLGFVHGAPLLANLHTLLPDRGPGHYAQLLRSARAALTRHSGNPVLSADETALLRRFVSWCDRIEEHWPELEKLFEGWPRTLIHGDFVIKNLRIQNGAARPVLLVYDWEMAGCGMPATDLAQSLGRCVSPDLDAYCAAIWQRGWHIDVGDLRRLADFGNVLRLVDKIYWETASVVGDTYDFLVRLLTTFPKYDPQLAAALRAVNWS